MQASERKLHSLVQLTLDCLCFGLIWVASIEMRILLNPFLKAQVDRQIANAWTAPALLIFPFWLLFSYKWRLYRAPERVRFWSLLVWAFETSALITALTAIATFFSRDFGHLVSRMFVPALLVSAFVILLAGRLAVAGLLHLARRRWAQPFGVALLGSWSKAHDLVERLPAGQARVIRGLIVPEGADGDVPESSSLRVLGNTLQLANVINRERLNRVIVLDGSLPRTELERCTAMLERMDVVICCAVDVAPGPVHLDLSTHYGLPFVEMMPLQFTRRQQMIKRVFDFAVSLLSLVALAPLLGAIAALIKLTSQGPVLYKSKRVGRGGRYFTFLKFRSMYVNNERAKVASDNEKGGHIFKMRNDPRVTPIGRILRRYSLDELPQLINVLRGDMSIVGPRPLPACDLEPDGMSKQFSAWSEGRSRVHPGLTGLWQVSGRSDLAFNDMVRLDLSYIENWSLGLDIRIIFETPMLVLRGVGAY